MAAISERQVVRVVLRRSGGRRGVVLRPGSGRVAFAGADEGDRVRRDGKLRLAIAVAVLPQRGGEGAIDQHQPSFGQILGQADMVLAVALDPDPCSDVLPFQMSFGSSTYSLITLYK